MTPAPGSPLQRRWWGVLAVVALTGTLASVTLTTLGWYPTSPEDGSSLGGHPAGWAGAPARLADALSYFTIWSNLVVALVAWLLARGTPGSTALRVLLLDALLMITITAVVYAVMLAPTAQVRGWENVTNPWIHIVTPAATVLLWLVAGPRGWLSWRLVPLGLVVPLVWVAFTLVRGALLDAYPYPFMDVVQLGYPQVAVNVGGILLFGLVVAGVLCGLDRLLAGRRRG
ncbi:Pr6Pr family membrane protein [Kytococcus sedentarius]|uniref:Pr6Pr family membrane protein n=1 Tax=Kytococcus sedentarius TaxID=1276 RepID=UPI0035BBF5D0